MNGITHSLKTKVVCGLVINSSSNLCVKNPSVFVVVLQNTVLPVSPLHNFVFSINLPAEFK